MTKRKAIDTMNRVRGMLMHYQSLINDSEMRASVRRTMEDLHDLDDLLELSEVHSDDEDEDEDDEE